MSNPTITLDLTNLDRNQTFDLIGMLDDDQEHYDDNTDAIVEHISEHAFLWIKEAEGENNFDQIDFLENVFLPDDYRADGIWYDQIGWRYDRNDYSVTTRSGEVFFNRENWLDDDATRWSLVEEASRIYSTNKASEEVEGIATALAALARGLAPKAEERPDKDYWRAFIIDFAGDNYENGERVE